MTRRRRHSDRLIPAFVACFAAGMITGWWLRGGPPTPVVPVAGEPAVIDAATAKAPPEPRGATPPTPAADAVATSGSATEEAVEALRQRRLRVPIDNADVGRLKGMFAEKRDGNRAHEAVDILAPRNTAIHAVEDGTIEKLFTSKAGGLTIYQFEPSRRFCYYYAHLEGYVSGLHDGQHVARGEIIGYVGTSGNAPANTPHLHFAIFELGRDKRWWEGKPIDPYLALR